MNIGIKFFIFFLLLISGNVYSQKKYWITFTDKDTNGYDFKSVLSLSAIENRNLHGIPLQQWTDVPVNKSYISNLKENGVNTICVSKWLNAVSAIVDDNDLEKVKNLTFVKNVTALDANIILTSSLTDVQSDNFSFALEQMNAKEMLSAGFTGKGIKIGVIDAGFHRAHTDKYLLHLFKEFKILGQRDFVNPVKKDIIVENSTNADGHGRRVLDMVAGYDEEQKVQTGFAVNSNFYLARTENGAREYRGEEDHWIEAMEWMDSLGVRLITTSLGYSINMDDPGDNYKIEEMNGKTARISKAAQIAVDEKGIFLVVSAGNQGGDSKWRIVSAPADAEGVLSVGATRDVFWDKIGYSSIGANFVSYLKPNVSVYSPDGTSFSAPVVAGFVACLMEHSPLLTNKQLKQIVEKSGHLYPYGNNYIGYGVPQSDVALKLLKDSTFVSPLIIVKEAEGDKYKFKVDNNTLKSGVVFRKSDDRIVLQQEEISLTKTRAGKFISNVLGKDSNAGRIELKRRPEEKRTTVIIGDNVTEVIWK